MRRYVWIAAVLAVLGAAFHETGRGQFPGAKPKAGDIGPGDQGATLRLPGAAPMPPPSPIGNAPAVPSYVRNLYGSPGGVPNPARPERSITQAPASNVNINKDIEITAEAGPWAIFVMAYAGPKAPELAREFVAELRNTHKLYAYVYNSGADEKQKEYQRVQKLRQEQIEALQKAGLKADMPIHVPTVRIEEQTSVLVGGYRTREEALAALQRLRREVTLDPNKVAMDVTGVLQDTFDPAKKTLGPAKAAGFAYVNPLLKAFPVRNPSTAKQQAEDKAAAELEFLRKVNKDEPLSLLHCGKTYTLAIKQFNTQYKTVGNETDTKSFLARFQMSKADNQDNAAHNAHDLGAAMRKLGMPQTYVLHSRFCSYVTVGGFDQLDDPQLKAMQSYLENRFRAPAYQPLEMFPRPIPMLVPR